MSKQLTRNQFLQAGLGLGAFIAGCGDSGTGGSGGGSGGSPPAGGSPETGGSPPGSGGAPPGSGGSPETGGSPSEGGGPPASCTAALVALISGNHANGMHALTIQPADLDSATDITYDISGAAQHCHEIILTVADFATLKGGGSVTKFTCNGGDHEISLSCGVAPEPGVPECGANDNNGACN